MTKSAGPDKRSRRARLPALTSQGVATLTVSGILMSCSAGGQTPQATADIVVGTYLSDRTSELSGTDRHPVIATTTTTTPPRSTVRPATTTPATTPATPAESRGRAVPNHPYAARCLAALEDVRASGLLLPAIFEYRCPGDTQSFPGDRQHWGITCHRHPRYCPTGAYIGVNPAVVGPDEARLRYTVAHETCHALDYEAGRTPTEPAAEACAAKHGFPRR